MKIFLIRHGETTANREGILQGQFDSPLNEVGLEQAKLLANKLKKENISAIYCSDLQRAYKTAQIIKESAFADIPCQPMFELRELSVGELEGKKWTFIENLPPKEFVKLMKKNKGEDLNQFQKRVWNSFLEIINKHNDNDNVAIITHGGCIRVIIQRILNAQDAFDKLRVDNGSITLIDVKKRNNGNFYFRLEQFNDISHIL